MGCPGCECPAGSSAQLQSGGSEELRKTQIPPGLHVQPTAQPCSPSFPFIPIFSAIFSVKMQLPFPGQCSLLYLSEDKELLQHEHHPKPRVWCCSSNPIKLKSPGDGSCLSKLSLAPCLLLEAGGGCSGDPQQESPQIRQI